MRVELVKKLTPDEARELFDNRDETRPFNKRRALAMTRALERDGWIVDGEPYRFHKNGKMRDGQHRAYAIAEAGITATDLVFEYDLDAEADLILDSGQARSFQQVLKIKGIPSGNVVAATTRLMSNIDSGNYATSQWRSPFATNIALWRYYTEHADEITEAVRLGGIVKRQTPMIQSVLVTFAVLANRVDEAEAADFFDELANRTESSTPVNVLRRYILNRIDRDTRRTTGTAEQRVQLGMLIKIWNRWRTDDHSNTTPRFHHDDKWPGLE